MTIEKCSVPNCEKPHEARGFCQMHYARLKRGVALNATVRSKVGRSECEVPDCTNRVQANGLCQKHSHRKKMGLPLVGELPKRPQLHTDCSFEGCCEQAVSRGLCNGHRLQLRDSGFLKPLGHNLRKSKYGFTVCTIASCEHPHRTNGMCATHNSRASRYGLTVVQFQMLLLVDQCPICWEEMIEESGAIDHDHNCCPGSRSCGKCVLGMICKRCNAGIGYFTNHPGTMISAIEYLQRTRPL